MVLQCNTIGTTPAFKSCWFLVKIDYDETEKLNMESRMTGDYHIKFYHVIPLIIIYVIIIHDGGYSGISMLQKK